MEVLFVWRSFGDCLVDLGAGEPVVAGVSADVGVAGGCGGFCADGGRRCGLSMWGAAAGTCCGADGAVGPARRGVEVRLVGVDLNPYAARAAKEWGGDDGIEWVTGDAFSIPGDVDVVVSSLFTHHLEGPEVVRFLRWMEATARRGWFVNDLCREAAPYYAFGLLAKAAGWHRFVQHGWAGIVSQERFVGG